MACDFSSGMHPFAGADTAVSAICWVPRGCAAEQPRSYLLEVQDRHDIDSQILLLQQQQEERLQKKKKKKKRKQQQQQQQQQPSLHKKEEKNKQQQQQLSLQKTKKQQQVLLLQQQQQYKQEQAFPYDSHFLNEKKAGATQSSQKRDGYDSSRTRSGTTTTTSSTRSTSGSSRTRPRCTSSSSSGSNSSSSSSVYTTKEQEIAARAGGAGGEGDMQVDEEESEKETNKIFRQRKSSARYPSQEGSQATDMSEDGSQDASDGESDEDADDDEEEEEEDEDEGDSQHLFGVVREDGPATLNDPYLNLEDADDSEEEEASRVLPTDLLLVAANAEHDCSTLEVYVYDEDTSSFYVHHDILTGGYPLCLEWLNTCPPVGGGGASGSAESTRRNLVASGSFDPEISLWDLDVLDRIDAVCTLGGEPRQTTGRPAAQKSKKKKHRSAPVAASATDGHRGPVMTLHKSPMKGHVLASGSADETIKLWDLNTAVCVHTYTHHTNKVQAVRWHPTQEATLLTTGYDQRAAVLDVRSPNEIVQAPSLSADAEACVWDRHRPSTFWVSTEDGCVTCYDTRRLKSSNRGSTEGQHSRRGPGMNSMLWRIQAHKQAASGVSDSKIHDLMVTCGVDGIARLWKLSSDSGNASSTGSDSSGGPSSAVTLHSSTSCNRNISDPSVEAFPLPEQPLASGSCAPMLVFERALKAGPLYCCSSNEDVPQVLGFGGSCVVVWDITDAEPGPLYCCSSNEDVPQVLGFGGSCVVVWDITDAEPVKSLFRLT